MQNVPPKNKIYQRASGVSHIYKSRGNSVTLFKSLNFVSYGNKSIPRSTALRFLQVLRSVLHDGKEMWGLSSPSWVPCRAPLSLLAILQSMVALPSSPVAHFCFALSLSFSFSCYNMKKSLFFQKHLLPGDIRNSKESG